MHYWEDLFLADDVKKHFPIFLLILLQTYFFILDFLMRSPPPWHFKIIKYKYTSCQRLLGSYQKNSGASMEMIPMAQKWNNKNDNLSGLKHIKGIFIKIKNKTRMSTFTTFIQHSVRSCNYCRQER